MSDSAKFNREETLKRITALEEKQRRLRSKRAGYVPTPGQLKILNCTKKNLFNFSGNGGGKTALNVQMAYHAAKGKNPWTGVVTKVPAQIAFVVDTSRKIGERIVPELNKWFDINPDCFEKDGKPYISKYYDPTGSQLHFLTADADPMSFEGVEYDWVFVDEPINRRLYVALKRSLRKKGAANRFIFSGTAITEAWLRKDVFDPWSKGELPDTECFTLKTADNAVNLDGGYLEEFSRSLTEAEKKVRLEGGFFDSDGLALAEWFKPEYHLVDDDTFKYDYRMPCVVAIDPHSAKPHTAILIAIDRDDHPVALEELTFRGNATQFAAELRKMEEPYNIVDRVCDSLGSMEMTSGEGMHSFIEGLRNNGIIVRATTFKEKSHEDLIDRLRNGLAIPTEPDSMGRRLPHLRIHKRMKRLISDVEQVTWQKNRNTGETLAKLDTSTKDYLSCWGYALALNIGYDTANTIEPRYKVRAEESPTEYNRAIVKRREEVILGRQARRRQMYFRRKNR